MDDGSGNKRRETGEKLDLGLTSIISMPKGKEHAAAPEGPAELPPIHVPEPKALNSIDLEKAIRDLAANQAGAADASRGRAAGETEAPRTSPPPKLDLGLSDLVKREAGGRADGDAQALSAEALSGKPMTGPGAEAPRATALALVGTARYSSSYRQLAEMNRWAEITSECEARLEDGEDPEAKVWWIYSQYKQNAMPISILASPLNEVSKLLVNEGSGSTELRKMLRALLTEFSQVLKRSGDFELALGFLERSAQLEGGAKPAPQNGSTERQRPRQSPRPEPRPVVSEPRPGVAGLNTRREQGSGSVNPSQNRDLPPLESAATGSGMRRRALLAVSMLLMLLLLLGGDYYLNGRHHIVALFGSDEGDTRLADLPMVESTFSRPSANPPSTERFTRVSQLNALFYDMEKPRPAPGVTETPAKAEQGKAEAQLQKQAAPREPDKRVASAAGQAPKPELPAEPNKPQAAAAPQQQSAKEVINTNFPAESDAIRNMDRSGQQQARNSVPEIDFPPYRQGHAAPGRAEKNETRYPRGRLFTVLYRTVVRDAPAENAAELDTLREGQRVVVVGRVGDWLQLESKRGFGGYIPSRDADDGYAP